jgi:hypothetical protein
LVANGQQGKPAVSSAQVVPGHTVSPDATAPSAAKVPDLTLRNSLKMPGQSKPGPARVRPILTHTLVSGLWRTDGGFVANIRIKNALVNAPLEVSPVLYLADGTEYRLSPVTVAVAGVAVVNINNALAHAPPSVTTHLSTFGSAALTYRHPSGGHLIATIALQDSSRSLALMYGFSETPLNAAAIAPGTQTWEGLWWKHDAGVEGFLALSNRTDQDTQAGIRLVSANGTLTQPRTVKLPTHSTLMFSLDNLTDGLGAEGNVGGVRVDYSGQPGSVIAEGGLLNAKEGYSANIPFVRNTPSQPGIVTLGSAGIMVGKPDPMMRFPAETRFTPYLVLRNTTTKAIDVDLQLNYTPKAAPISRHLAQHLAAMETMRLDLPSLLERVGIKDFSGSINVGISYTGQAGDLIMAAGSVDQSGTYVFEVQPQALSSTQRKLGSYWDLDDGSNTMYSLWNPAGTAQDVLVTLYYNGGSGKYRVPVHLVPQGSITLDINNVVKANAPDKDGNVFPPNTSEGSAAFESLEGPTEQIKVIISGAVFNVLTGTCTNCCVPCCGASDVLVDPSSDACSMGETQPFVALQEMCDGSQFDITTGGTWSSNNTAVATVSSSGWMTAVGVGSATVFFTSNLPATSDCGQPLAGECPPTNFQRGAPVNVSPTISSLDPGTIPIAQSNVSLTIHGSGLGSSPQVNLPSGVSIVSQNNASSAEIDLKVNVAATATIGKMNPISVTAAGLQSNTLNVVIDGPWQLVAQTDSIVSVNSAAGPQARNVKYQFQNFSTSAAANIPIAEVFSGSGMNCTEGFQPITVQCDGSTHTDAQGMFTDQWQILGNFSPTGCGFNISDQWTWCQIPGGSPPGPNPPGFTLTTLSGYSHTDSTSINGFVNPAPIPLQPSPIPFNTVFGH